VLPGRNSALSAETQFLRMISFAPIAAQNWDRKVILNEYL